jgi:hypothetical protein
VVLVVVVVVVVGRRRSGRAEMEVRRGERPHQLRVCMACFVGCGCCACCVFGCGLVQHCVAWVGEFSEFGEEGGRGKDRGNGEGREGRK